MAAKYNDTETKYEIVKKLYKQMDVIRLQINNDLKSLDTFANERGVILFLLNKTGIKAVWNSPEDSARKGSIKVKDVDLEPNVDLDTNQNYSVTLNIIGKSKIPILKKMNDIIKTRKEIKSDNDDLFTEMTEEKINDYLRTLNKDFTMDIFQTYFVCKTMEDTLWNMRDKDKLGIKDKFTAGVTSIAKIVFKIPRMSKKFQKYKNLTLLDYIDPKIIHSFCKRKVILTEGKTIKGIPIKDICDDEVCKVFEYAKDTREDYRAFTKIDKYKTVREFHRYIEDIRQRNFEDLNNECGIILYLLDKAGIRHGTERDGDSTGCCSLKAEHVKSSTEGQPYSVTLRFNGKDKIPYTGKIAISKEVHEIITKLLLNKSKDEDIFSKESEKHVVNYLKLFCENFTMKIFRTYLACISLERNIGDFKSNDKWGVITKFHECINIVAAIMNHKKTETIEKLKVYVTNPYSTLRDYIDPAIIHSFCKRNDISITDICIPSLCKLFDYAKDTRDTFKAFPDRYNDADYSFKVSDNENNIKTKTMRKNTQEVIHEAVEEYYKKIGDIRERIKDDLQSEDRDEKERGLILHLLDNGAMKAVWENNEGTSNCSLKVDDVQIDKTNFVFLKTIGQSKITINNEIKNIITQLISIAKDGDLFTRITEKEVNEYLKTFNNNFTMEIFQIYFVRKTTEDKLWPMRVKGKLKVMAKFNEILNLVATIMDNRKKVTINGLEIYVPNTDFILQNYIDPEIKRSFGEWKSKDIDNEEASKGVKGNKIKDEVKTERKLEDDNGGIQGQSSSLNADELSIKKESKASGKTKKPQARNSAGKK